MFPKNLSWIVAITLIESMLVGYASAQERLFYVHDDPNIGRIRCGFWLQPAAETRRLEPDEFMLWQARADFELGPSPRSWPALTPYSTAAVSWKTCSSND